MYRRYLIKRVLNALLNYLIIIFLLSLMFNTTAEKSVRTQVAGAGAAGSRAG